MIQKPLPLPLSMVVCDMIIEDKKTAKKSLIGMFSNISTKQVPCLLNRFWVFISMTEGIGDYTCALKCIRSTDNLVIGETQGSIQFTDRGQVVEITLDIAGLTVPEFGEYRLELYCDGRLLISRKFSVSLLVENPQQSQ